ncbi:putative mitochondrial carrier protein 12 [Elsinoe fawcettii]|nr:putative mitochondrial carrier protein 12 [Elsinoe fawcettii]
MRAGASAGIGVNLLIFPLDTLKTRVQSPSFQHDFRATGIANRALWRGLYHGIGTVLLATFPASGVFFTTYESLKHVLADPSSSSEIKKLVPKPAIHAVSSSVAQIVTCAILTPAEVLKQNAQMLAVNRAANSPILPGPGKGLSSPVMQVLQQMKQQPLKLWSGYTALLARDLPLTMLQFPAFEYLKEVLTAHQSNKHALDDRSLDLFERAWISGLSGGIAGSAAAWITTPFDVVKTRIMLEAGAQTSLRAGPDPVVGSLEDNGPQRRQTEKSMYRVWKDVFQEEGIRGMFRGGSIRTLFTLCGNGLFFTFYESARFYLQDGPECTGL